MHYQNSSDMHDDHNLKSEAENQNATVAGKRSNAGILEGNGQSEVTFYGSFILMLLTCLFVVTK